MALKIKVITPAKGTDDCGGLEYAVQWKLDRGDTGWVVQHVQFGHGVKKCDDTQDLEGTVVCNGTRPGEYWEAWRVDDGKVFVGRKAIEHKADTYRLAPHRDRKGGHGITGRVKFLAGYTLTVGSGADDWQEDEIPPAGSLPTRRTAPVGWTDSGARRHDVSAINWVCCGRTETAPTIDSDPEKSDEGVSLRNPVDETLYAMASWMDASVDVAVRRRLMRQLRALRGTPLAEVRSGVELFVEERGRPRLSIEDQSKLFLLNRFAFKLPSAAVIGEWPVFGGWLIPHRGRRVSPSWPFAVLRGGTDARLVGEFAGFMGDDFNALAELEYFAERFPLRWESRRSSRRIG